MKNTVADVYEVHFEVKVPEGTTENRAKELAENSINSKESYKQIVKLINVSNIGQGEVDVASLFA